MRSIREIFKNEALNFTPWLSKNLCKLTQVIHTDLILLSTEKDIEGKKLDIMAQEEGGNIVAIENQFGVSDFKHLGQIISYAMGSNASKIIWISERFHKIHLDALEWLNTNKDSMKFDAISVINPDSNVDKDQIYFREPILYDEVIIGEKLDAHNQDDKVVVDEELQNLIQKYQAEEKKRKTY
ncbi:MAG: hypothetical protein KGD74_02480 [Candidatus Lokiarchaeota archaeon]|nr:hypothetical protein [Candidatus Lokiarchaeota archaeon]